MDSTIFFFFYNLAHQSILVDGLIIFTAVYLPYIVVILAGLFLLFHHEVLKAEEPFKVFLEKKIEISAAFFAGVLAWIFSKIFKLLIHIPRPVNLFNNVHPLFLETGYGFPSGHATFFSALAVAIFLKHKKAGYIFMVFAFLIGIARIVSGVHSPLDIFGGFVLGSFIGYLVAYFVKNV